MSKFLDLEGLGYYTGLVKGRYDPQIEEIKTNISIAQEVLSQTYNSANCNISLYLTPDDGGQTSWLEHTHYDTSQSIMNFGVVFNKNQYKYWHNGLATYKYKVTVIGMIATNNVSKANNLTLDTPPVANETYVKRTPISSDPDGAENPVVYNWGKSGANIGDIWYIRPHVEYTDLETGVNYTMYAAVYKVTVGTPCIIECNTLSCTELTALVAELQARIATLEGNT